MEGQLLRSTVKRHIKYCLRHHKHHSLVDCVYSPSFRGMCQCQECGKIVQFLAKPKICTTCATSVMKKVQINILQNKTPDAPMSVLGAAKAAKERKDYMAGDVLIEPENIAYSYIVPFNGPKDPLSNLYEVEFELDGQIWNSVEQYYQYSKAEFGGSKQLMATIERCPNPMYCKHLGRKVRIDLSEWLKVKREVMYKAIHAKFTQNPHLLFGYGEWALFVEALRDRYWGCGIHRDRGIDFRPENWTGQNHTGLLITRVHREMCQQSAKYAQIGEEKMAQGLFPQKLEVTHNVDLNPEMMARLSSIVQDTFGNMMGDLRETASHAFDCVKWTAMIVLLLRNIGDPITVGLLLVQMITSLDLTAQLCKSLVDFIHSNVNTLVKWFSQKFTQAPSTEMLTSVGGVLFTLFGSIVQGKMLDPRTAGEFLRSLAQLDRISTGIGSVWDCLSYLGKKFKDFLFWVFFGTMPEALDEETITPLENWCDEVMKLSDKFANYSDMDPCKQTELYDNVEKLWRKGLQCGKELQMMHAPREMFETYRNHFNRIKKIYEDLGAVGIKQRPRTEPLFVYMYGESGVGKSGVTSLMAIDFLKFDKLIKEEDSWANSIYFRNVEQEYWDAYHGQPIIVYDDFGQVRDSQVAQNIEFMEIIRLGNIVPFFPHMSGQEDKGKISTNARVVLMTANSGTYKVESLTHQAAWERRIDVKMRVYVAPEYSQLLTSGGKTWSALDATKVKEAHSTGKCGCKLTRTGDLCLAPLRFSVEKGPFQADDLTYEEMTAHLHSMYGGRRAASARRLKQLNEYSLGFQEAKETQVGEQYPADKNPFGDIDEMVDLEFCQNYCNNPEDYEVSEDFKVAYHRVCADIPTASLRPFCLWTTCVDSTITFADMYRKTQKSRVGYLSKWAAGVREKFNKKTATKIACFMLGFCTSIGTAYMLYRFVMMWTTPKETTEFGSGDALTKNAPRRHVEDNVELASGDALTKTAPKRLVEETILPYVSPLKPSFFTSKDKIKKWNEEHYEQFDPAGKEEYHRMYDTPSLPNLEQFARVDEVASGDALTKSVGTKGRVTEGVLDQNELESELTVMKNMYRVLQGGVFKGNLIVLGGRVCLTFGHLFSHLDDRVPVILQHVLGKNTISFQRGQMQVQSLLDEKTPRDLAIVEMPKVFPQHPTIVKHLIKQDDMAKLTSFGARLVTTRLEQGIKKVHSMDAKVVNVVRYSDPIKNKVFVLRKGYEYKADTQGGDCGSPLFIANPRYTGKWLGLHVAGGVGSGNSESIYLELIMPYLKNTNGNLSLRVTQIGINQTILVTPCEATNDMDGFIHLGKVEPKHTVFEPGKSDIIPSLIHGQLQAPTSGPARLRNFVDSEGNQIDIKEKLRKKCSMMEMHSLDQDKLAIALESAKKKLYAGDIAIEQKRVLTDEESVFGVEGVTTMPSVNVRSSPGYPWIKDNKRGVGKTPWIDLDNKTVDETLVNAVNDRETRAKNNERTPTVWMDLLKDERRPLEKVRDGKTRLFSGGPMDFTILFRKYFLAFNAFVQENRIENGVAVGINPYGREWTKLANYLQSVGDNIIAGDFSNYDGTLHGEILWAVLDLINDWYDDSEENKRVRTVLWAEVVNSIHLCGNDLYQWTHSVPSGHPMTAILNSVYQIIALRYVWLNLSVRNSILDFEHVAEITYGDDNVISVGDEIKDRMTDEALTAAFAKIGMKYTDENKSESFQGFRSLGAVTFLKRAFHYDLDYGRWNAPMSIEALFEITNWIRSCDDPKQATLDNVKVIMREMALLDERKYVPLSRKVSNLVMKELHVYLPVYPRGVYIAMMEAEKLPWWF